MTKTPPAAARQAASESTTAGAGELAAGALKPGDNYVQSFARGLAVISSFGAESRSQTLSEVAERTHLTRAGARRILLTLLQLGYVEAEGRQFRLTPKVLELGFAYLSSLPVWSQAQPVMEQLVETLRQSCSAGVLDGDEIVYVLRVPAHKIMSINLGVGSRLPSYCSSMGRVLLAGLPEDELEARLARMTLTRFTPNTIVDRARLLATISQVRRQGWAMVEEELEHGLVSIAAPIVDRHRKVVAAINISGHISNPGATAMVTSCLPRLLEAADKINLLMRALR